MCRFTSVQTYKELTEDLKRVQESAVMLLRGNHKKIEHACSDTKAGLEVRSLASLAWDLVDLDRRFSTMVLQQMANCIYLRFFKLSTILLTSVALLHTLYHLVTTLKKIKFVAKSSLKLIIMGERKKSVLAQGG